MSESWDAYVKRHKMNPATDERVDFVRSRVWMGSIPSDEASSLILLIDHLKARVEESDHLLWVMSQDQEAYLRGKEDGVREERKAVNDYLLSEWDRFSDQTVGKGGRDREYITTMMNIYETIRGCLWDRNSTPLPPPMPPDRMRSRIAELEGVVRDLLRAYQTTNFIDQERVVGQAKKLLSESV